MKLTRVPYKQLTARQKEIYNFQKAAAKLADYGFNCIKLSDDWQGADFLAYHKDGAQTYKIQLKSRLSIYRKYMGEGRLYMLPSWKRLVSHSPRRSCGNRGEFYTLVRQQVVADSRWVFQRQTIPTTARTTHRVQVGIAAILKIAMVWSTDGGRMPYPASVDLCKTSPSARTTNGGRLWVFSVILSPCNDRHSLITK